MIPFTQLTAPAAYLSIENIDTDKLVPSRFLKAITRVGLGEGLLADMRRDPEFVLNRAPWNRAGILIAHENFGCGSSREHAPWALTDFGIRCVIAPSFADIFHSNCLKNGILPITLGRSIVERLGAMAQNAAQGIMTVDLAKQVIVLADGEVVAFDIADDIKQRLLAGVDDIARSLALDTAIADYERRADAGNFGLRATTTRLSA